MENLFVLASRAKFRFVTSKGSLTAEDLWDLPLDDRRQVSLDDVAKSLNKQLRESDTEQSFVNKASAPRTDEIKAKFDLVLFVIKTKLEERDAAKARSDKEANKQKIMALIERKKDEALAGKPLDELQALLNTM
jgi:hypothetical protein